jgi:hypothetical protein
VRLSTFAAALRKLTSQPFDKCAEGNSNSGVQRSKFLGLILNPVADEVGRQCPIAGDPGKAKVAHAPISPR